VANVITINGKWYVIETDGSILSIGFENSADARHYMLTGEYPEAKADNLGGIREAIRITYIEVKRLTERRDALPKGWFGRPTREYEVIEETRNAMLALLRKLSALLEGG
jgi:hypothetical protein